MRVTANNPFANLTGLHGLAIGVGLMFVMAFLTGNFDEEEHIRVAMIGNSLMYYNDLPRLLEAMSNGRLTQDSCLHGGASFKTHLMYGNGMFVKWDTGNARLWNVEYNVENGNYESAAYAYEDYMEYMNHDGNHDDKNDDAAKQYNYHLDSSDSHIYDFGACTVRQLLLGYDERLVEVYGTDGDDAYDDAENDDANADADAVDDNSNQRRRLLQRNRIRTKKKERNERQEQSEEIIIRNSDQRQRNLEEADSNIYYEYDTADGTLTEENVADDYYKSFADSFNENFPLEDDGRNPCLLSANYYFFKQNQYNKFNGGVPKWDYILLNDISRGPCCTEPRAEGIELLVDVYVPWILRTGAVPVFMVSHAYWPSTRDMSGLTDIPTFMSLTYEGYKEYAKTIAPLLPEHQKPRLAPVGLAFLIIWEENKNMWDNLIHMDDIHLTPSGSFLEGLIVYATLYGHLPDPKIVLNGDIANLFTNARRMTPSEHIQEAYPTQEQARYLYHIAARTMNGDIPRTLTLYYHGESANFTASDISCDPNDYSDNSNCQYSGYNKWYRNDYNNGQR